ncbi:MAG TPA: hypothetical protein VND15_02750 [Candidatus Acidoferrales bacterium]|nr:hypothetical protein [Candidatus Acidoferrales bacterium]
MKAKMQILSYNPKVLDSVSEKVVKTAPELNLEIINGPKRVRFDPSREHIKLYGTDIKAIRMRVIKFEGERADIGKILRIDFAAELRMKGGIYIRLLPTR